MSAFYPRPHPIGSTWLVPELPDLFALTHYVGNEAFLLGQGGLVVRCEVALMGEPLCCVRIDVACCQCGETITGPAEVWGSRLGASGLKHIQCAVGVGEV